MALDGGVAVGLERPERVLVEDEHDLADGLEDEEQRDQRGEDVLRKLGEVFHQSRALEEIG